MAKGSTSAPPTSRKRSSSTSSSSSSRSTKRPRLNTLSDELALAILKEVDHKDLPAAALLSNPMLRAAQELLFTSTTLTFVQRAGHTVNRASSAMVLQKEYEGAYEALLNGLARTVVRKLTFATTVSAPNSQSFTGAVGASEAISSVFRDCKVLKELNFPAEAHGNILNLVVALPSLPTLRTLSFCPGTMSADRFSLFTMRVAASLTHLTLITYDGHFTLFDLSPFSSLVELQVRCIRPNWGPSVVERFLTRSDLPTRCPSLGRVVFSLPGSTWRRRASLRTTPPIHAVIAAAIKNVEVLVKMEGWELLITNKPGKEWDWTDLNKEEEEEKKAEEKA
ncbi:hypothetical protein JCM6882_008104 [Rhodosporidiobolus microsporus]